MSSFHNNALVGASGLGGYQIERSLRFNSADSAYCSRVPASAGNRKTWTWSGWVKRSTLGANQYFFAASTNASPGNLDGVRFQSNDTLQFLFTDGSAGNVVTTQVFRDVSAWLHIVISVDTTQATAANRFKFYVNGSEITALSTATYPTQNFDCAVNSTRIHTHGGHPTDLNQYPSLYLANVEFVDGSALTPSSFGETDTITGVWKPRQYTGTYGTNGYYLKFADNSGTTSTTLGKDSSGNGNNWTPNNFSVTAGAGNDSLIDTPTPYADGGNGRGNYCTWLPQQGAQTWTFSNGNLDAVNGNAGSFAYSCIGTIAVSTGKWYWEVTCNDAGGTTLRVPGVGIMGSERDVLSTAATVRPDVYLSGNGTIDNSAGTALQSGFSNMAAGDIVGVALDAGAKTVQFYRNGSAVGTAQSYTAAFVTPSFYSYNTFDCNANFGQRAFSYTPPAGFSALNTQNLPEPSIKKPSSYMDVKLYTGNSATQSITGLDFSPDFVWIKGRSAAHNNALFDTIRGVRNVLISNSTAAEGAEPAGSSLTSFDASGFTLGANAPTYAAVNAGSTTYVAWCWDESATPGFDIVTYTGNGTDGRQIAHNLGVRPSMYITACRTGATNYWNVWHSGAQSGSAQERYQLWLYSASGRNLNGFPANTNTLITSTNFTPAVVSYDNVNTATYVAYLWSEVAGFSKFGSYTGNGSTDGPFVFCGFRPRWIMIKSTGASRAWVIVDTSRDTYNVSGQYKLYANYLGSENNSDPAGDAQNANNYDILSNGFKLRSSNTFTNGSTETYIFAAFAESPFKYSLAR